MDPRAPDLLQKHFNKYKKLWEHFVKYLIFVNLGFNICDCFENRVQT